jgi:hypothetical protein
VHRATAYQYFATAQSLLADAGLAVVTPDFDRVFSKGHFASADPADPAGLMDAAVHTVAEVKPDIGSEPRRRNHDCVLGELPGLGDPQPRRVTEEPPSAARVAG